MMSTRYILPIIAISLITSSCSVFGGSSRNSAQPAKKIETATPSPQTSSHDLSQSLAGEWVITAVDGTALQTEENIPYINFVPSDKRFYASNGCNVLNGDFNITQGGILTFGSVASTMMFCPDVPYENAINKVIADNRPVSLKFEKIGNESYLYMMGDGKVLLTLRRANMEYLNGKWQFTEINGTGIDDPEANIFFDVAEHKVHGNTGCNYFNGEIMFDPNVANSINFTGMGVTRMSCPKADQERNLLVGLEEATTVVRGNHDTIMLLNNTGKTVLTLKRVAVTDQE